MHRFLLIICIFHSSVEVAYSPFILVIGKIIRKFHPDIFSKNKTFSHLSIPFFSILLYHLSMKSSTLFHKYFFMLYSKILFRLSLQQLKNTSRACKPHAHKIDPYRYLTDVQKLPAFNKPH